MSSREYRIQCAIRREEIKHWFVCESHTATFVQRLTYYTELKLVEFILNHFHNETSQRTRPQKPQTRETRQPLPDEPRRDTYVKGNGHVHKP